MADISEHLKAKSDQLNNIDLSGGPITITIRGNNVKEKGSEQPVWIFYEGDDGKPWKPCKSMLRVIASIWGKESDLWIGRSLTIFRNEDVTFGKDKTGGIRISHMSHMDEPKIVIIPLTRGKFGPFTVYPMSGSKPATIDVPALKTEGATVAEKGADALKAWWMGLGATKQKAVGGAEYLAELKAIAAKAAPQNTDEGGAQQSDEAPSV